MFSALPPETNSGLMNSGPGSRSMMAAATAWHELASRLYDTAKRCSSITRAAAAHVAWLNDVAAQAEQTAARAKWAADAYDLALAAMVPPSVIRANRMLRTWLAETNCLGQSSPEIAAADSDYDQMWAQDVDTMHTYARACADAATVTPFVSPPPTGVQPAPGSRALVVAPDVISCGYQVISTIPDALDALSEASGAPSAAFDTFLSPVTSSLSKLGSLCAPSDFAINHLNSLNKSAALKSAATLLSRLPIRGRAVSGVGRAASVGTLSVPPSWIAKTPRPATVEHGWGYEPMHLVETGERPKWPQTR
ncbi:PPE family protein [Mycobacterium sp. Aquia_213]|uniref:PPE family protein n=1 Tax=Mycobacterium sp. Aquia_213 TaxID=2991728 RepID=UPI002271FC54|nr:PPE family protein [Mycobacterium sp. Aquia_213]WAC89890.1 PPE family protein [Mycobacterium sp. Aquia_213]